MIDIWADCPGPPPPSPPKPYMLGGLGPNHRGEVGRGRRRREEGWPGPKQGRQTKDQKTKKKLVVGAIFFGLLVFGLARALVWAESGPGRAAR